MFKSLKSKMIGMVICSILGACAVQAQSPGDPVSIRNSEKEYELAREKAFQLRILDVLHRVAKEAYGWEDVKVSSRTQAQAADLLWDLDAISAENYLVKAWDTAKKAKEPEVKPNRFRNYSDRLETAREVLLVARKRSSELAEKWLKELSDLAEEDHKEKAKGLFDDRTARSSVLLQMAMQVVETDVQAAATFAAESTRDGISFGLQMVLVKIQEKNAELAAQVFQAALQRVNSNGISDAGEIQILYSYLYTPGQISSTRDSGSATSTTIAIGRNRPPITPAAQLYPALAQEFLLIAATAILRLPFSANGENPETSAREQFGIIGNILARLGNTAPQLSQGLRDRFATLLAHANFSPVSPTSPASAAPRRQGEDSKEYRERLLDEILEESKRIANPLQRDIFVAQGVLRSDAKQYEKAISISGHIDDQELRRQLLNFLIYRASVHLIKNDLLNEAHKLLQKDEEPRHRAAILIVGGQKLVDKKDFLEARNWLNEAHKLFEKNRSDHEDWINIGFGLVESYARFDSIYASRQLDSTIKLIDKSHKAYNRDNAPLAINFSGLNFSDFTLGTKNFSLSSAVNAFSKEEFEAVLSSIETIVNFQAKGQATLLLCRKHMKITQAETITR
jgi:hypothetical protein